MRLINFGMGEIVDRLTILALKIQYGTEAGKEIKHFVDERNALLVQLRSRETGGPWFEHCLELATINARLWQSEDELRVFRRPNVVMDAALAAEIAFRIQALNDRRAELVQLINKLTGDHRGIEKVSGPA